MKRLSLFNNLLICLAILVDAIFWLKDISSNILSYNLICWSFVIVLLLPKLIRFLFKCKIKPSIEFIYVIFIIIAQLFGCIIHMYSEIYWYDSFAHFISGSLTAFLAIFILDKLKKYDRKDVLFNIIFIFGITLMVASLWEIFEFSSDKILGGDTQKVLTTGVNDTMKDIICALCGGIIFTVYYLYDILNDKRHLEKIL